MYTRGQVIEFLEKVFGPGKTSNAGLNLSVICPNCRKKNASTTKKKFVIHTQSFMCHCWVCNIKSKNLYFVLRKFAPNYAHEFREIYLDGTELTYHDDVVETTVEELFLPRGFKLLAEFQSDNSKEARVAFGYLRSRGLGQREFWYYKFGITTEDPRYPNRIIFPSFDEDGDLNFYTTRAVQKGMKPKYVHCKVERSTIVFNEININWEEELTIVEGPFDLVKCNDNATCMLGSDLSENHLLFQKIVEHNTSVLLAFDDDAFTKMYKTAKLLSQYGVPVRTYQLPENVHDVGEMRREEFISLISDAKVFNANDYLKYRIALL